MTNLLQQITDGIDGGGFDVAVSGEIGKLVEVGRLAVELGDNPDGIGEFAAALAALVVANLPDGTDVQTGLAQARGAIPNVTGNAGPDALAELDRFATLIAEDLVPLLQRTVDAARAIEGIAKAEFVCPPEPSPSSPPSAQPVPPSGTSRAAVAQERATDISARIDMLPSPLTPPALIEFLLGVVDGTSREFAFPIAVPFVDDMLLPVQTLGRWSLATPAEVGAELESSLTVLRDRLNAATVDAIDRATFAAVDLQTPLRVAELQSFATDYVASATQMAVSLEADDAAAAATEAATLDGHVATFETLRATQDADFTPLVAPSRGALVALGLDVHDRLLHLATQLEPVDAGALFSQLETPEAADAAAEQALQEMLAPIVDFMEDLGEKLDLSAIEGGVGTVAIQAQSIADDISGALTSVAQETRGAFAEVEAAIAALPMDALATDIRAAITDAGNALQQQITAAFAPLRNALAQAIQAISDAIDGLDPIAITDAVTQAVADITAILQDPAVLSAAAEIRSGLDQAAEAAGNLSFAPVTDEVINLIKQMENGLRALDDTELNDALIGLLNAALAVLPSDLRPVTQPLIDDLGIKIEQGPVELLEDIRAKPQEVVDRVRSFDPGALISQTLGEPFDVAKGALGNLKPSALLTPLDAVLEAEKNRLKTVAAPSKALEPVTAAFDQLLVEFDKLSPDALLKPIEDAIETAVQNAVDAAPIDEIFTEIEAVFDTIQAVLDTIAAIQDAMSKAGTALTSLQDPDAAVDAWRDGALDKIDAVPNGGALDTLLTEIAAAIDASRGTDLVNAYDSAVSAVASDLDGLDPESVLAEMVTLRQRLLPLMRALPAGADRTAVEDVLNRFDPLDPAHTGGLRAASQLRDALSDARLGLVTMAEDFEDQLHGADGVLTELRNGAANASLLRSAVASEIDQALVPVRFLIAKLGAAAVPVGVIATSLSDMSTRLTDAVGNILTGPASLQAITDAIQQVVDTVRNIDLAFVREALEGVFQSVRAEIESASPKPLIVTLDREFGETIDVLDLDLILPAPELAALDQSVADIAVTLDGFDPANLIGDAVQDSYEADVVPLVEALDVTPVFDALIEALRGLEAELEQEMERINTAYGQLLSARPGGGGTGTSLGTG